MGPVPNPSRVTSTPLRPRVTRSVTAGTGRAYRQAGHARDRYAGRPAKRLEARVARIKLVYLGGGSTRAAGTMAALAHRGEEFAGSEVVLVDLDADRLALVERLARRMVRARGLDIAVSATTDRCAALTDCDA